MHRAYQQDPDAVAEWKEKVFPEIKKKAKKIGLPSILRMNPV
ncbi:MAG: hypothetical protein KAV87_07525 [Desulfobacteraceae bacterium]|nr:hypothetical protein [Desulfobacteraceae bacterium]